MKQFILSILIFISLQTYAQCKTYLLSTKGDTVNCTDFYNHKQGKWLINGAPLRGEPGFTEEGLFKDDKKEGEWQRFNLMGDVIADENYKWGFKNGLSSYYNLIGLLRTESWKSIDPKNPYDTVNVYGLSDRPDTVFTRLMKVDATAVRHGTWTYYNPERGTIDRTEEYIFDQLVVNKHKQNVAITYFILLKFNE